MGGDGKWVQNSKAIPNDEADWKAKINGRARAEKVGRGGSTEYLLRKVGQGDGMVRGISTTYKYLKVQ